MLLCICYHTIPVRTITLTTAIIFINVKIIKFPAFFFHIVCKTQLLVLYALAIIGFKFFIPIFIGQSTINCRFYHSYTPLSSAKDNYLI